MWNEMKSQKNHFFHFFAKYFCNIATFSTSIFCQVEPYAITIKFLKMVIAKNKKTLFPVVS